MNNEKIVAKYHGVNVIESCGYYYPEVNGDVECKTIREVKKYIEDFWIPFTKNIEFLAQRIGVKPNMLLNFTLNLK